MERRRRWLWLLNGALIGLILVLSVIGFTITKLVWDDIQKARANVRENLLGMASQTDYEAFALTDAMARFAAGEPGVSRDDVLLRLDILYSRIETNSTGAASDHYLKLNGAKSALALARTTIEEVEARIETSEPGDAAAAAPVLSRLRALSREIHAVTLQAITRHSATSTQLNERRERLNAWFLIVLAGTILAGFLVIAAIAYQYHQVEQLRRGLENRVRERTAELSALNDKLRAEMVERERLETQSRTQSAWLMTILDNSPVFIVLKDRDGKILATSRNDLGLFGGQGASVIGKNVSEVAPSTAVWLVSRMDEDIIETGETHRTELRHSIDGRDRHFLQTGFPLRDDTGAIIGTCSIAADISDIREAEDRLRQAMKMEALGQLTGGIAHDFNNLLAVIVGNLDLLAEDFDGDSERLEAVFRAGQRGSELTQRLLSFARRQSLTPRPLDVSNLVNGTRDLLTRSLGEMIDVELISTGDLWSARVDAGQLENAIVNLAVNARDAMPGGGRLTISCANAHFEKGAVEDVAAGDYVVIAVADTGTGMSPETLSRAFDPFFTTKDVGQGSGLGLSMVYGFAKQSYGHVSIESAPGMGTTVRIYLPRGEAASAATDVAMLETARGAGETILVLEDDLEVSNMVQAVLARSNYRCAPASNAEAESAVLREHPEIDLVLSDVVLPGGESGPEFVAKAQIERPDLKVIYMSGYPADVTNGRGYLGPDATLLTKPFNRQTLTRAVSEALAASAPDRARCVSA